MSQGQEVRTLRQFLDSEQKIECDCSNHWICTHSGPLRLQLAIQRLGWEFDFYTGRQVLAAVVYCSVCGKRRPTFRLGWKSSPSAGFAGSHGAGMATLKVEDASQRQRHRGEWLEPKDWLKGGDGVRRFGPGK